MLEWLLKQTKHFLLFISTSWMIVLSSHVNGTSLTACKAFVTWKHNEHNSVSEHPETDSGMWKSGFEKGSKIANINPYLNNPVCKLWHLQVMDSVVKNSCKK